MFKLKIKLQVINRLFTDMSRSHNSNACVYRGKKIESKINV